MALNSSQEWLEKQVMGLVGAGEPVDQIVASVILGALLIASSSFSAGVTLILLPVPAIALGLGVLRLIPAVEARWPL